MIEEQIATAFFGRRKGKTLSPTQQNLIQDLLPALCLNPTKPIDDIHTVFDHNPSEIWMEVGFGGGEHMVRQAQNNPHVGMIGCEPFINGVVKALAAMSEASIGTIRLYDEDAAHILDWLPDASLDRFFLLYPDPWHKKRHWKRRFVSHKNLGRIIRVLKPGGIFRFASDIDTYIDWTLDHVASHASLQEECSDPSDRLDAWSDWQRTRYEEKAFREGRKPQYLSFVRK
ncbi:tRNA (guanosine(46)-N7)-methyltransferase TrmB [Cohaesibacter celericrescens]|uniref:tRNA (guanine-N(7)-)-methyltransferase n=1 Tax=Cohaesibacter celericrescens TaxID=2067669 RepID=A0A2N5XPR0_9HYPH|nr:tRNA (guanosine(46)-N7)-methyltransferase TrmB [Cohaesibacter celericrescens]PLW76474.1 tRNA (guanosine(46)-N7)-methyltransferase TrmB [Cohaesibacter celericrescens]